MRHCITLAMLVLLLATWVSPIEAGEGDAAASKENLDLKRQVRDMRAQMQEMQRRLDALEAQVEAGPRAVNSAGPLPARTPEASGGRVGSLGAAPNEDLTQRQQILGSQQPSPANVASPTVAPVAAGGAPAPPPGVVPAGVPLPAPTPQGQTVGEAVKGLLPGPVTGPTTRRVGPGAAEPGRGVIVSSIEGVPKVFIPDIGAVGDFTLRQSDLRPGDPRYNPADDQFRVRDGQIILFSPIDPYTIAQISIDKPDRDAFDIEEAFLVFNKLPWDLTVRAGQYRPRFGLINETDTFQLPMLDRPQALAQYIGDDGFVTPGVNVTAYVPNPWGADIKADMNMVTGHNTQTFNHNEGQTFDFAYMGTLAYSRDLFRTGAMSMGASVAGGPGPGGQTYLQDPFLQVQYVPSQRQIWTWSLEGLLAERQGVGDHGLKSGLYSLLDYNFWLRYHAGLLVDAFNRPGVASGSEVGISPIFTYFVSDNTRLRFQYTHQTGSGPDRAADFFFTQATFSLGNLKPLE